MRFLLILLSTALWSAHALAQSAEETVAYIMVGADDGVSTKSYLGSKWTMNAHMTDIVSYFIRDKFNAHEVEVERLSDCRYRFRSALFRLNPTREIFKASQYDLDFTNAREYVMRSVEPDGSGFIFKMTGLEQECRPHPDHPEALSCDDRIGFINFGDAVRAEKALAYLKSTYCKGKAF